MVPCQTHAPLQTLVVLKRPVPRCPTVAWLLFVAAALLTGCGDGGDQAPAPQGEPPFMSRPTTDEPGARRLVQLATTEEIPGVAEQSTTRGRCIGSLAPFGARVYLGYGDYSDNTGPISAVAYDVRETRFIVGSALSTEELLDFQTHAGYLFAADLDPRGHEALGSVFRLGQTDGWHTMPEIAGAVHTFGMAEYDGQLYVGTGSIDAGIARIAASDDAGQSWHDAHTTQSQAGEFTRYTHLGATRSELFASGRVYGAVTRPFAYFLENGAWQELAGVPSDGFLIPLSLSDELFMLRFSADRGKGGAHLDTYQREGVQLTLVDPFPSGEHLVNWSVETRGSELPKRAWILSTQGAAQAVYAAEQPTQWDLVIELPELDNADSFTSITYLDNTVYLGTKAGAFFAVEDVFVLAQPTE